MPPFEMPKIPNLPGLTRGSRSSSVRLRRAARHQWNHGSARGLLLQNLLVPPEQARVTICIGPAPTLPPLQRFHRGFELPFFALQLQVALVLELRGAHVVQIHCVTVAARVRLATRR